MCNNDEVKLKSFSAIVQHMYHEHHDGNFNQFTCLISSQCGSFANLDDLKNHYATDHQDIVTLVNPFISLNSHGSLNCSNFSPSLKLKCATCDTIFDSPIKFGKHICLDDYQMKESEVNFKCSLCRKQLASRKRYCSIARCHRYHCLSFNFAGFYSTNNSISPIRDRNFAWFVKHSTKTRTVSTNM